MLPAFAAIAIVAYLLGSIPIGYLLCAHLPPPGHPLRRQRQHRRHQCASRRRQGARRRHFHPRRAQRLRGRLARRLPRRASGCTFHAPAHRRSLRGALRRSRTHVPRLAAISRRQRRRHRLRSLSGCLARGLRLSAIGLFAVVLAISRYRFVESPSIVAAFSFPVFAWFLVTGARPPFFFIAAQSLVALLIIVKHHQNIRRLIAAPNPASEPQTSMSRIAISRFRRLGNRHRALAPPPRRPPGHVSGRTLPSLRDRFVDAGENTQFLPGFPIPPAVTVTGDRDAITAADIVVSVIPSEFLRAHLLRIRSCTAHRPVRRQRHQGPRRPTPSFA